MVHVLSLEDRIKGHLQRLADDIGARSIGTVGNAQAFEYVQGIVSSVGARWRTHETTSSFQVPEWWRCTNAAAVNEELPILPGFSTPPLDLQRMPVMQRVYATVDDFIETPPQPGSLAIVSLGRIHETQACLLASPAAAIAWFREGHRGLYSGNCMGNGRQPLVPGFAIEEDTATEWITYSTWVNAEIVVEKRPITIRNIVVDFGAGGPKPCFVTHYDSKPMSPGGNDNASGVAVLLALLETWPHDRSARFIFFDGEEAGLQGSRAYVDDVVARDLLGEISCVINPDSVGLGELHLYAADQFGPFPDTLLRHARLAFDDCGWPLPERAARSGSSDYLPFHELGVPCLFLSDFPNYVRHTTVDTAELIDTTVLARLATVLASGTLANAWTS